MPIRTMDCLRDLGFVDGYNEIGMPCLTCTLSAQTVYATEQMGRYFQMEVTITGVITTSRTLTMIDSALPVEVDSPEQGLGWISYCLRVLASETTAPAWLIEGRTHWHTLP